jgi:hypothetical protein
VECRQPTACHPSLSLTKKRVDNLDFGFEAFEPVWYLADDANPTPIAVSRQGSPNSQLLREPFNPVSRKRTLIGTSIPRSGSTLDMAVPRLSRLPVATADAGLGHLTLGISFVVRWPKLN